MELISYSKFLFNNTHSVNKMTRIWLLDYTPMPLDLANIITEYTDLPKLFACQRCTSIFSFKKGKMFAIQKGVEEYQGYYTDDIMFLCNMCQKLYVKHKRMQDKLYDDMIHLQEGLKREWTILEEEEKEYVFGKIRIE